MISAKIILDSVNAVGNRLITYELTYPRFIHSEFMTHRMLSKNAASSRAIPISKMVDMVKANPAEIVWWGKNQSGMQAKEELSQSDRNRAEVLWNEAQETIISYVEQLQGLNVHKQISNRLLEPFSNITVICTGTEWANFFALRCHEDAQPEIRELAFHMLREYYDSIPHEVYTGSWHCPYILDEEVSLPGELKLKISAARCARVSYLTHDGVRSHEKDLELYERLLSSGHMSPFEHVACSYPGLISGNFKGWKQFRKKFETECRTEFPSKEQVTEYFQNK
jgi:thymidylate synthase ThyX